MTDDTNNSDNNNLNHHRVRGLKPFQFKKGQSGNLNGRPRTPEIFKKKLNSVAEQILKLAELSDDEAIRLKASQVILDRVLGKAHQSIELSGDPENPVNLKFVDAPPNETREEWEARVSKGK